MILLASEIYSHLTHYRVICRKDLSIVKRKPHQSHIDLISG